MVEVTFIYVHKKTKKNISIQCLSVECYIDEFILKCNFGLYSMNYPLSIIKSTTWK